MNIRWESLALVAALTWSLPANALEVLSLAHAPANPVNHFTLQCGRTGTVAVTAIADVQGEVPTVLVGGVEVNGTTVAMKKRVFPDGPALDAEAKKLAGNSDEWILGKVLSWKFTCRSDCAEIAVDGRRQGRGSMEFKFVVGAEGIPPEEGFIVFRPRTTAETGSLTLTCQKATDIGD